MKMSTTLKHKILKLLEEDKEFRYAVAGLIGLKEILNKINENTIAINRNTESIKALQREVRELQREVVEHSKAIKALQEQVAEHSRYIDAFRREIVGIGARWGVYTESAFRNAMREVVEKYFGGSVRKWVYFDEEGFIFGQPSHVDVDVVIKDREHILIEVKSRVNRGDVYELYKIGQLYEKLNRAKPRLIIVTPYAERGVYELAAKMGIKVLSKEEVESI